MKEGISFFKPNLDESHSIPLTSNNISAGFPLQLTISKKLE